jgi:hypothetical protein
MKNLFAAFAFVGLMACGSEAPAPREAPIEAAPTAPIAPAEAPPALDLRFEAGATSAKKCPIYAPRCCGILRADGTCVGNCVARNAECP